jgi:hypothetical protein
MAILALRRFDLLSCALIRVEMEKLKNPLRPFILPLLLFSLFLVRAEPCAAEDFIAGTVLSADIEKMEIVIVPLEKGSATSGAGGEKHIIARLSTDILVVNRMGRQVFPGCVYPGGIIRLWGRMDEEKKVFFVTDIRGWGGRGSHDPTGVRRRLQRGGAWNSPNGQGFHGGR